jgi:cbb3-type cytochrome oxidase maturation protein
LYLLVPLSAILILVIIAIFAWAVHNGQFDHTEREGMRILEQTELSIAENQTPAAIKSPEFDTHQSQN